MCSVSVCPSALVRARACACGRVFARKRVRMCECVYRVRTGSVVDRTTIVATTEAVHRRRWGANGGGGGGGGDGDDGINAVIVWP